MDCAYCKAGWPKDEDGHHVFPNKTLPKYADMRWVCREKESCAHQVYREGTCIHCGKEWSGMAPPK